ncbi:hypothetical protein SBI_04799 [Streptomyces bingchenggensis BCW-1]|uniref:Uncharacterized protein n=1 Tax=Streptomyces bingchenggensis (strain BCW-1) TaxID=749414 RepID=D7C118_STRBB|nr:MULTISPECIES: hypothetical protein [Streptomyces]ADI07919.1 hypothetical protein SBI_04799 [Streptomyces bingchenggensis BCW-1]
MTLPLWVVRNGEHQGDGQLRLSLVEAEQLHAEQLHAELCYVLGDSWNTAGELPVCRERGATAGVRWP